MCVPQQQISRMENHEKDDKKGKFKKKKKKKKQKCEADWQSIWYNR